MEEKLTHIDESGRAKMVDVGKKDDTKRKATAQAIIGMKPETLALIKQGQIKKGDVLSVAQIAGVMGSKRTPDLIPMCHPLLINGVEFEFDIDDERSEITIRATVKVSGKTGVEMEALTAVSVAALTVYDMCKALDRAMTISDIYLLKKSGGKSGVYERETD